MNKLTLSCNGIVGNTNNVLFDTDDPKLEKYWYASVNVCM